MITGSGGSSVGLLHTEHVRPPVFNFSDTVEQTIMKDFGAIPEVLNVKIEHEQGEMRVWIAMSNPPRDLRYKVYDMQAALIEAFPKVDLYFNLIPA